MSEQIRNWSKGAAQLPLTKDLDAISVQPDSQIGDDQPPLRICTPKDRRPFSKTSTYDGSVES